jgi:hypothetical protein
MVLLNSPKQEGQLEGNCNRTQLLSHLDDTSNAIHQSEKLTSLIACFCTTPPRKEDASFKVPLELEADFFSMLCQELKQAKEEQGKEENEMTQLPARKKRQGSKMQLQISQALSWVAMYKLEACAGRIVCELSCDSSSLGQEGKALYDTLVGFHRSRVLSDVPPPQMAFYLRAHTRGLTLASRASCKRCHEIYRPCARHSRGLVQMVANFNLVP